MSKKFRRKWVVVTFLILLVLAAGLVIFNYFNPNVGFQYYEPAYLPPGVSIKARRIAINKFGGTRVEQNFRTVDWVYEIAEYQAGDGSIGPADQKYDPSSPKPTCSIFTSPGGLSYRLCHWVDYGRIDVHEVEAIKGDTFIRANIPIALKQSISVEQIGRFVDSFKPKSTIGIPVLRTSGA